ncbi:ATP-binding protein [uncultured Oscillibacter sp.]|uniref:ATP-binding protein n=1 Tax=uncultured Oscillibacter sp. TaxID=876091 RepID=UPI0026090CB1|nr:AAA family ATPase [uncultured Oscillibacter sp.]
MLIHRAAAVFGKLDHQTLTLHDGLNILQAPNETGKSTWCAFLLAMFYGINSRERDRAGAPSGKTLRAPWSGAAMSGQLDCRTGDGRSLSLYRSTRRTAAPMAEFRAVYTGTADPVPELTGSSCGETLLGVSREVFARSAFIGQSGLAITQDAGLERRIAALITSGEEDTSYSEAAGILKKELNRRRHNKTGQLPSLEAELQETEERLTLQRELARRLESVQDRCAALAERETALEAERAGLERSARRQAENRAAQAEQRAESLACQAQESRMPEMETIGRLRGAIVNLETTRRAAAKAREQRDEARSALLRAEAAVNESPFTGLTPEQAERIPPDLPPRPRFPLWAALPALAAGLGLGAALYYTDRGIPLALGCGGLAAGLILLVFALLTRNRLRLWEDLAAQKRAQRQDALLRYAAQYRAADEARKESAARSAAYDGLYNALTANEQGILLEVRRFAPAAFDIPAADAALRAFAVRRKELSEAEAAAREARLRLELLASSPEPEKLPAGTSPVPPGRDRAAIDRELRDVQAERTAALSEAGQLTGRLQAAGDPLTLQAGAERLRDEIAALETEYSALELAAEALEQANTALQGRFSPALGQRAAEIFAGLTGGAYQGVTLDRTLRVFAQDSGGVPRESVLLSAGTADQLYLAVRLAICQLVLPPENAVPIILDDALSSFDDQRCAAALRWLRKEAEHRQILLFTCHSREADFFRDDPAVSIQRLDHI